MSKCSSCNAEIVWIKMASGKMMPCDATPISYSTILPGQKAMKLVTGDGRIANGVFDPESKTIGYMSHFATCPNAGKFRN